MCREQISDFLLYPNQLASLTIVEDQSLKMKLWLRVFNSNPPIPTFVYRPEITYSVIYHLLLALKDSHPDQAQ